MENGHLWCIYPVKMVIVHRFFVCLPVNHMKHWETTQYININFGHPKGPPTAEISGVPGSRRGTVSSVDAQLNALEDEAPTEGRLGRGDRPQPVTIHLGRCRKCWYIHIQTCLPYGSRFLGSTTGVWVRRLSSFSDSVWIHRAIYLSIYLSIYIYIYLYIDTSM